MKIEAKFKIAEDRIAHYEVSFDGAEAVYMGEGADGRSKAASALEHYKQVKLQKDKYLRVLASMKNGANAEGSLTVEPNPFRDADGELYHTAKIDGHSAYEGYDIDDLNIKVSSDRKPSEDHQGPGF